ncbi:hypothetical protein ALO95_200112 [Pseudomonas syringae pv. antirrhini]|uniref:Uncharacterized protein n=1 Tax=Pseudomonas amygdali pv. ulmi TaxID=251720 RepID=A0A0Q0DD32_PSEA0|nr:MULTISPECIES: hypothetical protein [Pseudomonas syringae group]KPZ16413.1 hypothetical protein ALO41_200234 [Pseudomonas amygdali pv. ulmi]KWS27235.1 hypothetical protein AL065_19100 [Pseudomonas amygdali pv. ulmi]RMP44333.1 hypothetical protein ALQ23_200054 [Pseudomonas syringae pv. antirrhini]RMW26023.1 hypothetical protein ALO95_200112 [Pseudomonas syringae pv. antirrhini]
MQMHEVFEVTEAVGVDETNRLIQQDGWKLVAVTQRDRVGTVYVLGKPKQAGPKGGVGMLLRNRPAVAEGGDD